MKYLLILLAILLLLANASVNAATYAAYAAFNIDGVTAMDSVHLIVIKASNLSEVYDSLLSAGDTTDHGQYLTMATITDFSSDYLVKGMGYNGADIEMSWMTIQPQVNTIALSGDVGAADNFETMLDSTGGQALFLKQLRLECDSASQDTAFIINGGLLTAGRGLYTRGAARGFEARAKATSGIGGYFYAEGSEGTGLYAHADETDGYGAQFYGGLSTGYGIKLTGNYGLLSAGITGDYSGEFDTSNFTAAVATEFQGAFGFTLPDFKASMWGDTTGYTGAGGFGAILHGGITADLSDADIAAVADTTWNRASSDHTTAGTFGAYVDQKVSDNATPTEVAAQVVSELSSWADTGFVSADSFPDDFITANKIADSTLTAPHFKSYAFPGRVFGADFLGQSKIADDAFDEEHITTAFANKIAGQVGALSADVVAGAIVDSAIDRPDLFYGPGAGSGANTVRIYAVDTSGTDDAVDGVQITVRNTSNVLEGVDLTNASGYSTFSLNDGTWKVLAASPLYQWATAKTITVTGAQYDTIFGYDYEAYTPQGCSTGCATTRVWGLLTTADGDSLVGATIMLSIAGNKVWRAEDSAQVFPREVSVRTKDTPVKGYWELDVVASDNLFTANNDSVYYNYSIEYKRKIVSYEENIFIPDTNLINIIELID